MPLHLDSITNDNRDSSLLAWMLQEGMNDCDAIFISEDHLFFHIQKNIVDLITNDVIGRLIYTIKNNEERKTLEVLDLDIVLNNPNPSTLRFLDLRSGSEANEYYEVETLEDEQHLEIETVNRHTEPGDLLKTERNVYISVFPFQLSVYESINEFNKWAGFEKPVTVGNTDLKVGGFSETFTMIGGMFEGKGDREEHYSFMLGTIESFRDVKIAFGETILDFVIASVNTALGVVPVTMGREVFDLSNLSQGCIVAMNADVKADIALPGVFKSIVE